MEVSGSIDVVDKALRYVCIKRSTDDEVEHSPRQVTSHWLFG